MRDARVIIVGAGPTGLALALGLSRHGIASVLLEKEQRTSRYSKAPGLHVRTREVLRLWGLEDRFLEEGTLRTELTLHSPVREGAAVATVDFSELEPEADRPGLLILEQAHTERLLLEAVREAGLCDVRFGSEVTGLRAGTRSVAVDCREWTRPTTLTADFVVGCDGAGSRVRSALALPFDGITYSVRPMLADVRVRDARDALPWPRLRNGRGGITSALRLSPGLWRLIRLERGEPDRRDEVPEEEIRTRVEEVLGPGPVETVWASRFRIHRRASPRFRDGRVLLAGDAAHVHSPAGGLGMNGGIQDAHNLAWKLAAALNGGDADRLLDSYDVERRAVMVEKVSAYADLLTRSFLDAPSFVRGAAFGMLRLLSKSRRFRRLNLRRMSMLDLAYSASPLLPDEPPAGVRLPNPLLLGAPGGPIRLYDLLSPAGTLLQVGHDGSNGLASASATEGIEPAPEVVRIGAGELTDPTGQLEALVGAGHGWLLVRPDAHVAWARTSADGLPEAVRHALGR